MVVGAALSGRGGWNPSHSRSAAAYNRGIGASQDPLKTGIRTVPPYTRSAYQGMP